VRAIESEKVVVSNMIFIFHFIYGMSSFPLTFIFFKMVIAPPTSTCLLFFLDPKRKSSPPWAVQKAGGWAGEGPDHRAFGEAETLGESAGFLWDFNGFSMGF